MKLKVIVILMFWTSLIYASLGVFFLTAAFSATREDPFALPGGVFRVEKIDLTQPAKTSMTFSLQSVIIGPKKRTAMINGHIFEESDRIADWRLIKIETHQVVLRRGDERKILEFTRPSHPIKILSLQ